MKRLLRLPDLFLVATLAAGVVPATALTPTEWASRQTVEVAAAGITKIPLPPATFDRASPDLADLRIVNSNGQEFPYLLDRDLTANGAAGFEPGRRIRAAIQTESGGGMTQLLITTNTKEPIDLLELETSAPYFLKAAHVDVSADGEKWESVGAAFPLFRQFGAEQLRVPLRRAPLALVRITIDDTRSRPVPFSGASLRLAPAGIAPPPLSVVPAQIGSREEFSGESVLTITLPGRQVPLAELHLEVTDALFMRRVTVAVREVQGGVSGERVIGSGTVYRVALEGSKPRAELDVPIHAFPPERELLVHIHNGDSPPLSVTGVEARQHPVNLIFMAPASGTYLLLSGNPQASAPRYDLAVFAGEMRAAKAPGATVGAIEDTPNYRPREPLVDASLADVPLLGAPLDTKAWSDRRPVQLVRTGVQELELDPAALARSRSDYADVRLLREGNQIPYVLEQPALSRSLSIAPVTVADSKRPTVSVWRLSLPHAGLPLQRVVLASTTPLFQRSFRLYEKWSGSDGSAFENTLASGDWSRTPDPGNPATRIFEINARPHTDTLWLEADNGDNPPVNLGTVQAVHPVVRLVFKAGATDGFSLAYGNARANPPRYDLSLVAVRLLTASRSPAALPSTPAASGDTAETFFGAHTGTLFWIALAVVVIVLLVVVGRLLPKPPA